MRRAPRGSYRELIAFVADRPGHDLRYAIDAREDRARTRLAAATRPSRAGLRKTVRWYLDNAEWWGAIRSGTYRGERLGGGRLKGAERHGRG